MMQVREGKEKDRDSVKRLFWKAWYAPEEMQEIPWWNRPEEKRLGSSC